jgi:hypothetical protein
VDFCDQLRKLLDQDVILNFKIADDLVETGPELFGSQSHRRQRSALAAVAENRLRTRLDLGEIAAIDWHRT